MLRTFGKRYGFINHYEAIVEERRRKKMLVANVRFTE